VHATEINESLPKRDEKRWFTPDECKLLLKHAEGKRVHGPLLAGLLLGLRVGEVSGLKWEDIDFNAGVVRIRRQVQRHGGSLQVELPKSRAGSTDLPLPIAFERLLREHPNDSEWLFPNSLGKPWEPTAIYRAFMSVCKDAGLLGLPGKQNPCFHSLRTTYVTLGNRAAVSVKAKQAAARHSSYDVTLDVYTQLMDDELRSLSQHVEQMITE
jgi:integrase